MPKVLTVLGTRPEIIKLSPILPLLQERFEHVLVHSGQHYAYDLDARFFEELGLPAPDYALAVGSASHGAQTAAMLARLEPILVSERPDVVLVQGDTNTTLAGGLCAAKMGIPVAHLEAGERSFNRQMPEELNRIVVDHLSALLLAADEHAYQHLRAEGLPDSIIHVVGSTAIDAVQRSRAYAGRSPILDQLELAPQGYLALTMHRAENTTAEALPGILAALEELASEYRIIFPIHPRTRAALERLELSVSPTIQVIEPLGYLDMLQLAQHAQALLTDSGGLQEEAGALGTPALVLRNETEWTYLIDAGANALIGTTRESILSGARERLQPAVLEQMRAARPQLSVGAAERAVAAIAAMV